MLTPLSKLGGFIGSGSLKCDQESLLNKLHQSIAFSIASVPLPCFLALSYT